MKKKFFFFSYFLQQIPTNDFSYSRKIDYAISCRETYHGVINDNLGTEGGIIERNQGTRREGK